MVWIRTRIFRAAETKHIKEGLPNRGHVLNKRRREHIEEGLFTEVSATLTETSLILTPGLARSQLEGLGFRVSMGLGFRV